MNLIKYIESLNLRKEFFVSETCYIIDDQYYITIEFGQNVFFVNNEKQLTKERYINITTIEELKNIYRQKTGKNLEHLLRKEKLKKLNNIDL